MTKAVYAGSFDPLTLGHMWVVGEGVRIFDELIVAVGNNPQKKYMFSMSERISMIEESLRDFPNVTVEKMSNEFLVHFALDRQVDFILRGMRNSQDFEFEKTFRHINAEMQLPWGECDSAFRLNVSTVFVIPPKHLLDISSSTVKALCGPTHWEEFVEQLVPEPVMEQLKKLTAR